MQIFNDFISQENKSYNFRLGTIIASSLTGFICGAVVVSIFWYILFNLTT